MASPAWRTNLERGVLLDKSAEFAWKQAAQPILVSEDPFVQLMLECDGDMAALAKAFAERPNPLMWSGEFETLLRKYHALAYSLGYGGAPQTMADAYAFQVLAIGRGGGSIPEADFVLGFLQDLMDKDPRYFLEDGTVATDEMLRRMRMYQGKMRGSSGWGFVDSFPAATEYWWRLGAVEDHCLDCPHNADVSPWYKETLYTTPGSGDTPCLFNCKCWLEEKQSGRLSSKPLAYVA